MGKNKTIKNKNVYSLNDYNSGDGMLTSVWGPSLWHSLHTISFNYPISPSKSDKEHYRKYILDLKHILPCGKCRANLVDNFKKLPLLMKHMESRETFSKYVYELHELINSMLGKRSGLSYDEVRERYEHFRARCTIPVTKICTTKTRKKSENGCTEPLYGEKSKCILKIVPNNKREETFQIDDTCIKKKLE
jgi:hypothetical protein